MIARPDPQAPLKKYEIYLPLKCNDGREIEAEKIKQIVKSCSLFLARSLSAPNLLSIKGVESTEAWNIIDDIIKIEIIAGADRKIEGFFRGYKEPLKRLLKQIDILITAQNIRTI